MTSARDTAHDLAARYAQALRWYLESVDRDDAFAAAYTLGREAIDTGLGVLDLAAIHQHALTPVLHSAGLPESHARMSERAFAFFSESLAPFEMVHRGFRDANARLWEANEQLERYAAQLAEAKSALEDERATLAGMSGMTDGVVLIDAARRIRYCNARASQLLGAPAELLTGGPAEALSALAGVTPVELESWLSEEREPTSTEISQTGPPLRDLLVQTFIADTGTGTGRGLVLRDVTAERQVERAKDELVEIVSHELRSPMTVIYGFADLLLTRPADEEKRRQHLATIRAEATRLIGLINHFLDLQRIEDRHALRREPIHPTALVERAAAAVGHDVAASLSVDVPASLQSVSADPERILQVLVNLLSNAHKYSPGGGDIRVSAQAREAAVEICVVDQGLGLPPEAVPLVFEKFYRVGGAERQAIRGTGLGLAICREIIEAHGGTIWAESDGPGFGSRFCFRLPAAATDAPTEAPP